MSQPLDLTPRHGLQMGDLQNKFVDQYFGLWAVHEPVFRGYVSQVQGLNLHAHVQAVASGHDGLAHDLAADVEWLQTQQVQAAVGDRRLFAVAGDGVAVIRLRGPLMKTTSSLQDGSSTVFARRQLRQAAQDAEINSIVLAIDSPGGTVAGTQDLAAEVARTRQNKPVRAYVEDLTASAAYWIASQAEQIVANQPTALIGSIGTYAVLHDLSGAAEKLGLVVHVIKSGALKGMGEPGTPITPDQLAEAQRIVDALNAKFVDAVADGRSLTRSNVEQLADGRIHPAEMAQQLQLIDRIDSIDAVIEELSQ